MERIQKFQPTLFTAGALVAAAAAPAFAEQKAGLQKPSPQAVSAEPKVINDGSNAKTGRVENMHLTRYIEMFLVMKGFQVGIAPKYTYEQFVAASQSQYKQLPAGWKFRVKTLEKELIETPANGIATILADEFFNVYDKTGPGMTNYKPQPFGHESVRPLAGGLALDFFMIDPLTSAPLSEVGRPVAVSARTPHNIRMHLTGYSGLHPPTPAGDAGR